MLLESGVEDRLFDPDTATSSKQILNHDWFCETLNKAMFHSEKHAHDLLIKPRYF